LPERLYPIPPILLQDYELLSAVRDGTLTRWNASTSP
jgi:hypothetical protein